jgi:hypothetical protein
MFLIRLVPGPLYAIDILATLGLTKFTSIGDLVSLLLSLALWFAGFLLFVGMIYAGIKMMGSGGADPKAFETNKQMLTNSIIGFILVISAVAIVKLIEAITGIKIIG